VLVSAPFGVAPEAQPIVDQLLAKAAQRGFAAVERLGGRHRGQLFGG